VTNCWARLLPWQLDARCRASRFWQSSLAIQFLAQGVQQGEPGVLAMFEETPVKYLEQAKGFGLDLQQMADGKKAQADLPRPLDLSVDQTLHEIQAGRRGG